MLTLISATPSPFARMDRISLLEKGIPFEIKNEIPWESDTQTPEYNPLEKLPVLIFNDGRAPIYDSAFIQEYIVQKYADKSPKLLTGDLDLDLQARQIQTLSEGCMDAFVLGFFEQKREASKQSKSWMARQDRKIDGAMTAFDELAKNRKPKGTRFLLGDTFTIADIAVVCAAAHINFAKVREGWQEKYPDLAEWFDEMNKMESVKSTAPVMFDLKESVV